MVEIFNDIRRLYKFQRPCPELADLIEFYSETSAGHAAHCANNEPFTVKLFPSYTPTIWINLGAPYYLQNGTQMHFIDINRDVLLLRDQIVERQNLPSDNIFTVKFNPGALEVIIGLGQYKLTQDIFDANAVIPGNIIRRMKKLDSFEQRYTVVEGFLLEQLHRHKKQAANIAPVTAAIESFIDSGMRLQTEELASRLYVSGKTFNRYFHSVTGTNPKTFLASVRARAALTAYKSGKEQFSVYDYGYFDPGHFYKDVVKFTGKKLSAFK